MKTYTDTYLDMCHIVLHAFTYLYTVLDMVCKRAYRLVGWVHGTCFRSLTSNGHTLACVQSGA